MKPGLSGCRNNTPTQIGFDLSKNIYAFCTKISITMLSMLGKKANI